MWIWNLDDVKVSDVITTRAEVNTVWLIGTGVIEFSNESRTFKWTAIALPQGWSVEFECNGKRGSIQGSTFNLPLEVAKGARRVL